MSRTGQPGSESEDPGFTRKSCWPRAANTPKLLNPSFEPLRRPWGPEFVSDKIRHSEVESKGAVMYLPGPRRGSETCI